MWQACSDHLWVDIALRNFICPNFFLLVILPLALGQIIFPPSLILFFFWSRKGKSGFLRWAHAFRVESTQPPRIKSLNLFLNPNIDKSIAVFQGAHWPVEEGLLYSWLLFFFLNAMIFKNNNHYRNTKYNCSVLNSCLTWEQSPWRGLAEIAYASY